MKSHGLIAVLALAFIAAPARALFIKPQLKQTLGSGNYAGTYASIDFGSDLHFKPSFNNYHSNTSSGTFKTYALRAAYDFEDYGLAVTGGWTPFINGYKSHFASGDVSYSYDFDGAEKKQDAGKSEKRGVSRLDLGAGITETIHSQSVSTPKLKIGIFTIPASTSTVDIDETDVNGNGALTAWDYVFSLDVTKSVYNKDIAKISTRAAGVTRLSGLVSTIQGFPDFNVNVKIECDKLPVVSPYISYTYTTYKVAQPLSVAYLIGLLADIEWVKLDASYERFAQKGAADINYYSLGATLRF